MMFRHRQQLRLCAALVLLLWLFGFGAGVANACMGSTRLLPGRVPAAHADGVAVAHHAVMAGATGYRHDADPVIQPGGSRDPAGAAAMANCLDFCEKASLAIPPLKTALDDLQGHALHSSALAAAHPAPVLPLYRPQPHRRDDVWAPSVAIAFLRLTL